MEITRFSQRQTREGYPGSLLTLLGRDAPETLWVAGAEPWRLGLLPRPVSIVGARASTAYGDHVASQISEGLTRSGHIVVSGGAYGIDAAAHRGALAAGGRTVVVLPGGVDVPYPRSNSGLFDRVVEEGGLLVSAYPPGSVPIRARFLERNRLIAALGMHGMVVVEAGPRSGSMHAARQAHDIGVDVMAVPGPVTSVTSEGTNGLIRDGRARLVTGLEDVLEVAGR